MTNIGKCVFWIIVGVSLTVFGFILLCDGYIIPAIIDIVLGIANCFLYGTNLIRNIKIKEATDAE